MTLIKLLLLLRIFNMLCLIDEPLGCAKTSGPYFLLALIAGLLPPVIYHTP